MKFADDNTRLRCDTIRARINTWWLLLSSVSCMIFVFGSLLLHISLPGVAGIVVPCIAGAILGVVSGRTAIHLVGYQCPECGRLTGPRRCKHCGIDGLCGHCLTWHTLKWHPKDSL